MSAYSYSESPLRTCTHAASDNLDVIVSDRDAARPSIRGMGMGDIACLYLLIDTAEKEVYVGETGNACVRIAEHCRQGPGWGATRRFNKVVVAWDGRPIKTTRFSDGTVRRGLEARLIRAFDEHGILSPTNKLASRSRASTMQECAIEKIADEVIFVTHKLGYLNMPPHRVGSGGG